VRLSHEFVHPFMIAHSSPTAAADARPSAVFSAATSNLAKFSLE
jgi:hypothetical protein